MDLLPFFEWLDQSLLAQVSKAYGGVFAVIQMFHLLALALLGGTVLLGDLRLLGVLMTDVPSEVVIRNTHRWFQVALAAIIVSGIFMASAVAMKLYYNQMFAVKMLGLGLGLVFFYLVRRPLLAYPHATIGPWALRGLAVTSLGIWFTVAAAGRWIGFS
jgi:hypothetical protein